MRRRLALVIAAAVAALGLAPATAASPELLRVSAGGTSETALVLTRPAVLDQARMTTAGQGRLAGFAVLRVTGELVGAEVRVTGWTDPLGQDAPVRVSTREGSIELAPGRYRLVVFADGPTRVTVPLAAGRGQTLRAARPTTARARLTDLNSLPVVAGAVRDTLRYPGGFVLSQTYQRTQVHQAAVLWQCFARAAERAPVCSDQPGFAALIVSPGSVGAGYTSAMAASYGRELPVGEDVDVLLEVASADVPSRAEWLTLTA